MESSYVPKMPDWQSRFGLSWLGQRRSFVDEALEQNVDGNPLPPCLVGKARFDFPRNFDTHGGANCFQMPKVVIAVGHNDTSKGDWSFMSAL